jgi:hypothetical protein
LLLILWALAGIICRVHVPDAKGPLALIWTTVSTVVNTKWLMFPGRSTKPPGPSLCVLFWSSLSPVPKLNSPEIIVTGSLCGCW